MRCDDVVIGSFIVVVALGVAVEYVLPVVLAIEDTVKHLRGGSQ